MTASILYDNQGKIRNQPVAENLSAILKMAADAAGIDTVVITSGGQPTAAEGGDRTGSTRHDHGNAADIQLKIGGRTLSFTDANDRAIIERFVTKAAAGGATGIGAGLGYMGPSTLHVGFGNRAVWGEGGRSANAPDWLARSAQAGWSGTGNLSQGAGAVATAGAMFRNGQQDNTRLIDRLPRLQAFVQAREAGATLKDAFQAAASMPREAVQAQRQGVSQTRTLPPSAAPATAAIPQPRPGVNIQDIANAYGQPSNMGYGDYGQQDPVGFSPATSAAQPIQYPQGAGAPASAPLPMQRPQTMTPQSLSAAMPPSPNMGFPAPEQMAGFTPSNSFAQLGGTPAQPQQAPSAPDFSSMTYQQLLDWRDANRTAPWDWTMANYEAIRKAEQQQWDRAHQRSSPTTPDFQFAVGGINPESPRPSSATETMIRALNPPVTSPYVANEEQMRKARAVLGGKYGGATY